MNKRAVGAKYENLAVDFLKKIGYDIIERNYRYRGGEIDIVARDNEVLVMCEVKYRKSGGIKDAVMAVDYKKQRQISKVCAHYLSFRKIPSDTQIRFDVVAIDGAGEIMHIKNAFYYSYI